jgi:hypothetical protein
MYRNQWSRLWWQRTTLQDSKQARNGSCKIRRNPGEVVTEVRTSDLAKFLKGGVAASAATLLGLPALLIADAPRRRIR